MMQRAKIKSTIPVLLKNGISIKYFYCKKIVP